MADTVGGMAPDGVPDLPTALADPSHQLADAIGLLTRALRRASVEEHLNPTLLSLLGQLYTSGRARPSDLAEAANLGPPAVTRAVAALEDNGLVCREPDPDDGRAIQVLLTDRGRQTLARIIHQRAQLVAERRARLTDQEQATLDAAVPLLRRLAED